MTTLFLIIGKIVVFGFIAYEIIALLSHPGKKELAKHLGKTLLSILFLIWLIVIFFNIQALSKAPFYIYLLVFSSIFVVGFIVDKIKA